MVIGILDTFGYAFEDTAMSLYALNSHLGLKALGGGDHDRSRVCLVAAAIRVSSGNTRETHLTSLVMIAITNSATNAISPASFTIVRPISIISVMDPVGDQFENPPNEPRMYDHPGHCDIARCK